MSMKARALATAALVAVAAAVLAYSLGAWPRIEHDTVDLRFDLRPAAPPRGIVVVAIDDKTFSDLRRQWPFPRSLHADVIRRLHEDGARTIGYDVQFTEPTEEAQDLALFRAVAQARNVVLATTEVDAQGHTAVLGGDGNVKLAHAVAAASNLPADPGGVIRRYRYSELGLQSFAAAVAQRAGHPVAPGRFGADGAWIDFRGPPGTIPTVSFSDVLAGRVDPRVFAGKIVVVGASTPTLQDVHPTSTASADPMAGPEIQANAIWTATHGNPLKIGPGWLALLAIVLAGAAAPLASLRLRVIPSALLALVAIAAYLGLAQLAFDSGTIVPVSYPLAAWALGLVGMVVANHASALVERNAYSRKLGESQLELIQRLAAAVEFRDNETGEHIQRIGLLCERVALRLGWDASRARMLRHASAMHDIGKIGVPDSVLLKPGKLDDREWDVIRAHPATGGEILAGSANPLVQMAERIARSHHERWDGGGYPQGLKGEEIPIEARICSVCDVYDALLSKRPYKESWKLSDTLAEIRRNAGSQFDPRVVEAFLELAPALAEELRSTPALPLGSAQASPA